VLVIGGSGSGKTRFFVKPNLLQMHSSYVVTDPKGSILVEIGNALKAHNYDIKVLNTINFKKSMKYNPFAYIRSEKDILKLVNTIIANTKGDGEKGGEDFWVKAERLLLCALIGYIYYEASDEEKNIITLITMINASETKEDNEDFKNIIDEMFDELEEENPDHFAVRQYKKYKLAAGVLCCKRCFNQTSKFTGWDCILSREIVSVAYAILSKINEERNLTWNIVKSCRRYSLKSVLAV
jgi:type IV secretory pathway TraG/TraD family ATPase VirD4